MLTQNPVRLFGNKVDFSHKWRSVMKENILMSAIMIRALSQFFLQSVSYTVVTGNSLIIGKSVWTQYCLKVKATLNT